MAKAKSCIPEGLGNVTAHLIVKNAQVIDPFGHVWEIATHTEDLTPEELGQRAQAAMAAFGKPA